MIPNSFDEANAAEYLVDFMELRGETHVMEVLQLDDVEPITYKQEKSLGNANEWQMAMQKVMESIWTNQVWDLFGLLSWCKTIRNMWVLKIKYKADRWMERYKAQLIAKDYTQQEGID